MSSYDEILFNYEQAIKQAESLEKIADNMKNSTNEKIDIMLTALNNSWNSDNSPNYFKKIIKTQEEISTLAKEIFSTAQEIRKKAEEFREAELTALSIATTRDYNV